MALVIVPGCQIAGRLSTGCQQAVNKLSREKIYFAQIKHIFSRSRQQTKILTLTQTIPNIKTDESFPVAVRRLSGGCRAKSSHFEAKIKFERWFRHHRRAYPIHSVLTSAKFDLHFRLSRRCSSYADLVRSCWSSPDGFVTTRGTGCHSCCEIECDCHGRTLDLIATLLYLVLGGDA